MKFLSLAFLFAGAVIAQTISDEPSSSDCDGTSPPSPSLI